MNLMDIQPTVQNIADAIASVLKIEVEIANQDFIRVAGTGEQESGVLQQMEGDLVYQSAVRTGRPVIIENPGFESVCERCFFYQNCSETGEICSPITYKGEPIGVIGLLAFNEEQRTRLFENTKDILSFLEKMANLLVSKLHEHEMLEELTNNSLKMAKMMNLVEQGIIIIDEQGNLAEMNVKAKMLLGFNEEKDKDGVCKLLNEIDYGLHDKRQTIQLNINGQEQPLFATLQKLITSQKSTEYLLILQAVEEIQHLADQVVEEKKKAFEPIVGISPQLKEVKDYAFKASQSHSSILIMGESGTGKEEFAKAIHRASPRKEHPFITVNCGAIPDHLLESELFGYEKGAFTGANQSGKPGKFELANNGTIFLDEIGEMPAQLQVKLLRVLQQMEVERLGGTKTIPIDVRVIAATNRNLQSMVDNGLFREDLYFRLNVIPMMIPTLRSRKEDILALSDYFIKQFNEEFQANVLGFGKEVKELMLEHAWKGNVRELKNFIEYVFNFIQDGWITLDEAGPIISRKLEVKPQADKQELPFFSLEKVEKETIEKALIYVKKNDLPIDKASELLNIGRATLFRKIKKYQIDTSSHIDTSAG
ncbi:sigma-54-dependent Fis family transcriptional regulator [Thalassobacillus sp. B23F22_16]|uniref:sigma-54-dependent Fis family transcriptional regulator n=1 Tax=Thalassobacillus sp. B23F22_16 TaxID=3459513 RepID=UPI00373E4355